MLVFSNPGHKYMPSSNRANTDDQWINTSSVTKDVYICPCISLIRHTMYKYIRLQPVLFNSFYFGRWKRIIIIIIYFFYFLITTYDWKISYFEMTNFQALNTLKIYSRISKIRLLIQITLYKPARIKMDLLKE